MGRIIKQLEGNRCVMFDSGSFDDWCVYVVEENGTKKAPFDVEYFTDLKTIAQYYTTDKVYDDFVAIYELTTKIIDPSVLEVIDTLVETYHEEHQIHIEQWFTVLYAGMIAEENKEFAMLKKRIKRLGMHQTLKLDFDPKIAAHFSKGKKWRDLDALMSPLGF